MEEDPAKLRKKMISNGLSVICATSIFIGVIFAFLNDYGEAAELCNEDMVMWIRVTGWSYVGEACFGLVLFILGLANLVRIKKLFDCLFCLIFVYFIGWLIYGNMIVY